MPDHKDKPTGHIYSWEIAKASRSFRAYVVEPDSYDPIAHGELFQRALASLLSPTPPTITGYGAIPNNPTPEEFDLITFPEAFLAADDLVVAINSLSGLAYFGAVHVGLRPKADIDCHLFSMTEIAALLDALANIAIVNQDDLKPIRNWLDRQQTGHQFNLGCLFLIDAHGIVRVCIHPKMVRSQEEFSVLAEKHMEEGDLFSLISLKPQDRTFSTVTLQPLLCSDAILIPTDRGIHPLTSIAREAGRFSESPPDHIDIVSVATCTKTSLGERKDGSKYYRWHQQFRRTFESANLNPEMPRHRFATFILSNFRIDPHSKQAGLSGAFIPVPIRQEGFPDFLENSSYGRTKHTEDDNLWSEPSHDTDDNRETRGYLAQVTSIPKKQSLARMLGFNIAPPRFDDLWSKHLGFSDFQMRYAIRKGAASILVYESAGASDV